MKAATLRNFLHLHTWVGLLSGLALFIAFYAGAITVFSHEVGDWNRRGAQARLAPDPIERSQQLLDRLLREKPQAAESIYIVLPGEHGSQPTAYWYEATTAQSHKFAFDDHEALRESTFGDAFIEFIYDLHFTAGLPKPWGTYLFGVVSLLYGLALVSGVVIYAPGFLKSLFALRLGRNTKQLWQDAHNAIGILSLPFHVVFAWSGAVLTIGLLLLLPFNAMVYDGKINQLLERDYFGAPQKPAAGVAKPTLPLHELLTRSQAAMPGLEIEGIGITQAGDANAQATAYGIIEERRLNTLGAVVLDATSGRLVASYAPTTMTPGMWMLRGLQALHYGSFGHEAIKWLYFALGLAGAFLFYSGNLLWIEARRKRRQQEQPLSARLMAALTLGVCLGCIAGVSAVFIAGALWPDWRVAPLYFAVFLACLAWACLRQPARAAQELLWVCAALTALIPVAGWSGMREHLFAAAWHGHWHRFFVDALALVMALTYAAMARGVHRRSTQGDPNSVWALR